jgi:hypothetical protein
MNSDYPVDFSRVQQPLLKVSGSLRCSYTSGAPPSLTQAEHFPFLLWMELGQIHSDDSIETIA